MGLRNPFFAMDTGTKDAKHQTAAAQVAMLKELGYAGCDHTGCAGLAEKLAALDEHGLRLFAVYLGVWVEPDSGKYDAALPEAIKLLKGRDVILWLSMMSRTYGASSPEGDRRAVEVIREIADMAREYGVRVALYPHINTWLERVDDAVRVAKQVARDNVGVTFNLFHWLRVDDEENMRAVLELALPHLYVVTINGSSHEGSIETLDRGSFDLRALLGTLKDLGYAGPIALQGYGIGGDVHENLSRSMAAWRKLAADVGKDE